jgi:DNA-binding transcriptional regulator YhcF (GntR family)
VQKVYASLDRAGLISTKVGLGTFVVHRQVEPVSPLVMETRIILRTALHAALQGGLSVLDVRQIFETELSEAQRLRETKAADVLNSRSRFARWQVNRS